jgi:hypothetical protein
VTAKQLRPVLLNSCAQAATASEARFRINAPRFTTRASRIVAVDEGAAGIVRQAANELWTGDAHFLVFDAPMSVGALDGPHVDAMLRTVNGAEAVLSDELTDADVAVMVATTNAGADAVSVIGQACFARAIMTAGLVVAEGGVAERAVASLRPHAMVLVVTGDEEDVPEMLRALRV